MTATEDLMREHGVIRRALLVYYEVIPKLRQNAASVDAAALQQTAEPAGHAEPLAKVFEAFVLMYQDHAAHEDTIVFPA